MASASSRTVKVKFDGDAKGLGNAAQQGERHMARFEKAAGKMGSATSKIGDMLGKGMKVGALAVAAAGIGLGAAAVKGVQDALDQSQIRAKLAAQLGATGPDAKRLGRLTGDLYKAGFGETYGDVADLLKTVFEQGLVTLKDSDAQIKDITASVATYTQLTGEDATTATRAVAQMLKTGLAPNAKAAFDTLIRGQQLGINKSEDLLDTFNEYGTQFRKLGLSANDSLGLMNQLIRGGARDSDVAADAIKEFSIRAVDGSKTSADGFKSLGLSAEGMAAAIAKGGPTARTAFGQVLTAINSVKDPVERNRIGVELFGTQWEDLGGAIRSADLGTAAKSLGQVAGATDRANKALSDTPAAKLERVKRLIMQTFVDALGKYALPQLEKFADWFNGPGKFVMADWGLAGAAAVLSFADMLITQLQLTLRVSTDWAAKMLRTMAGTVGVFGVAGAAMALKMNNAADSIEGFGDTTDTALSKARTGIKNTQDVIAKARLVTKLTADKEDLDRKLATAKAQLADPKLSATKKALLKAEIADLLRKKTQAQAAINSLTGKTVAVTLNLYRNLIESNIGGIPSGVKAPGRASGGLTQPKRRYLLGERGAEIAEFDSTGTGGPRILSAEQTARELSGGDQPLVIENHIEIGGEVVRVVRSEIRSDKRSTKRIVKAGAR